MFNLLVSNTQLLYIDPAATSVLISSITAIAVAAGAGFIILWRRLKKKMSNALHIDENRNKEVEDELIITDAEMETGAEPASKDAEPADEAKEEKTEADEDKKAETVEVKEEEVKSAQPKKRAPSKKTASSKAKPVAAADKEEKE